MALTGPAAGPPAIAPGAPAVAFSMAIADIAAARKLSPAALPSSAALGERAALAGYSRRAPWSVGGSFHALPAADGWLGLSLPRTVDVDLLGALVGTTVDDPWRSVRRWAARLPVAEASGRARLLGMAAGPVAIGPPAPRRPAITVRPGGPRTRAVPRAPLVLDLTSLWAGPLCAHLLGLAGARVVKLESVRRPDGARLGPAAFFNLLHARHESVALDFTAPEGAAALRRLFDAADVVLEASRPRALRQLGFDAEEYVDRGAIWASITAYGREGEDADLIGFGDDVAAAAGLTALAGGVPYPVGDAIADPLAGVSAASAVAVALQNGRGALLDVSMYDVAVEAANVRRADATVTGDDRHGWYVQTKAGRVPVVAPRARAPAGVAAPLGAHTRVVLDGLRRQRARTTS
jgi:hypothetical protein